MFKLGIENLVAQDFAPLKGQRVGLMSNPSAVDRHLRMTYDILRSAPEVNLTALFGPEHGFLGATAEGILIEAESVRDSDIPVFSLYGSNLHPTKTMLDHIDVMVCDIQDIGVRYYTFLWTMSHVIEACGEHGKRVIVLDRPNPSGAEVNGSPLDPDFQSLVGRYNIPIQHGMTLGEMLSLLNQTVNPTPATLEVIPCVGYTHDQAWESLDLHFVPPSPNMPRLRTVRHYPGACLIEGTNLSEGRGTALPFEVIGAPYIDAISLAEDLNALELAGVRFRAHHFTPTTSKFSGEHCHGVHAHITDREQFDPIPVWLDVIRHIRHAYPDDFAWRDPYTENSARPFDHLIGNDKVRQQIDANQPIETITDQWTDFLNTFKKTREQYLLYA